MRRKKNKKYFVVEMDVPRGIRVREVREYISVAVKMWAKGGDPENPLFDLRAEDLKVKQIR